MIEIRITDERTTLKHAATALAHAADQLLRALNTSSRSIEPDANDDVKIEVLPRGMPSDPMMLREIKTELRLNEKQIVTLRRLWGFPVPCNGQGYLIFSRREVEAWANRQPNPDNLAAVLRLRRRDKWRIGQALGS